MDRPLRIVVISQFFSPEMGAPAARFHDFGRLLCERGHEVTVVTGFPNFPSSVVAPGYRGRWRQRETIDGITVCRGWLHASPRWPGVSKSLGYASFAASASLWGCLGGLEADVVVATSPPPTVAIPGLLTAWRLRAPLVFDVRDIWPEAVVESGRLHGGPLVRALEAIERTVYRRAAAVTVVTEGKRERLIEKGVPAQKLEVVPNGVDVERFSTEVPVDDVLDAAGVDPERFRVIYAGIFGPSQGLDLLLDAVQRLQAQDPVAAGRVQLVLVGSGVLEEHLRARCRDEGLGDRVVFVPEQPRERIPSLLRACDAVAVTLRARRDLHTVPSKLYESIASGRPVLLSADGAPGDILRAADCGLASRAGDVEGFVGGLRRLLAEPELAAKLGARGRAHAVHFDRRELVTRLETLLQRVVAGEPVNPA